MSNKIGRLLQILKSKFEILLIKTKNIKLAIQICHMNVIIQMSMLDLN